MQEESARKALRLHRGFDRGTINVYKIMRMKECIMPVCVPIKDMRDTAAFSALVENTPEPVTVTKNGYSKFVVMRSEDYDALMRAQANANLMARLAIAEQERKEGDHTDALDALNALEAKYGL